MVDSGAIQADSLVVWLGPRDFGPYELIDRIGVGGMAEVFLARQRGEQGFERLVAIKRILPHVCQDDDFVRMFIDEAKIAVQLSHPNIAQVYDLGREGETYFIAQEYVAGRDMGAIADRHRVHGRFPIPFVVSVALKVCEALAYAHEATTPGGRPLHLIHRDISPSNILVSFEGAVKVIDFGLAKASGRLSQTQAGVVKGKLAYLSSEQARGMPIDNRSDIFSLATCMYEWLTGTRLFARNNDIDTVIAVQKAEVPGLRAQRPEIPEALEAIILYALRADPRQRFASAQELHDALIALGYELGLIVRRKDLGEFVRALFPEHSGDARAVDPQFEAAATASIPPPRPSPDRRAQPVPPAPAPHYDAVFQDVQKRAGTVKVDASKWDDDSEAEPLDDLFDNFVVEVDSSGLTQMDADDDEEAFLERWVPRASPTEYQNFSADDLEPTAAPRRGRTDPLFEDEHSDGARTLPGDPSVLRSDTAAEPRPAYARSYFYTPSPVPIAIDIETEGERLYFDDVTAPVHRGVLEELLAQAVAASAREANPTKPIALHDFDNDDDDESTETEHRVPRSHRS